VYHQSSRVVALGMNSNTSEADIKKNFAECGEILNIKMIYDQETKVFRGFCFITFKHIKDAKQAVRWRHHYIIGGRKITVKSAEAKQASGIKKTK
jgi:RNA recognition motif-containing protein